MDDEENNESEEDENILSLRLMGLSAEVELSRMLRSTFAKFSFQISFIIGIHHEKFDEIDQDHILKQQIKNEAKIILMSSSQNFREIKSYFSEPYLLISLNKNKNYLYPCFFCFQIY